MKNHVNWRVAVFGLATVALTVPGRVSAQPVFDTTVFSKVFPVKGDIPGLYRWANSRVSDSATVTILSPKEGQRFNAGESLYVAVAVSGVGIGEQTRYADLCGIANSAQGQHTHVIVDNMPYKANYATGKPFAIGVLPPGIHTVRVFASRSWHESVKSPGSFKTVTFFVGDTTGPSPIAPRKPLLTYSRPKDVYEGEQARAILVDFYLSNCPLSPDGYKARLTIDGKSSLLTSWVPYLVSGLVQGEHRFKLELLDAADRIVSGAYNATERTITVK